MIRQERMIRDAAQKRGMTIEQSGHDRRRFSLSLNGQSWGSFVLSAKNGRVLFAMTPTRLWGPKTRDKLAKFVIALETEGV